MKKIIKAVLAFGLCLLLAVPVWADAQSGKQKPDYTTDYYMIVESKAGGIDIYSQPDFDSEKLNDELIPNGTALHIEGEVVDKDSNRTWGYTTYRGMNGYAPLDDCKPAESRQEAIDSELYIAGRDNVDYNADYDVKAYDESGSQHLYQGPGEKYGTVPGVNEIQNGETLHITKDANMVDGSHWGATTVDGKEGWMDLDKTEENAKKNVETVDMIAESENGDKTTENNGVTQTPDAETTSTAELTATPEPETTSTPATEPTVTSEATPTVEPTTTPEATPTKEAEETPEPTATQIPTVTSELTEVAQSSSAAVKNSKEKDSMDLKPFLWIGLAAVVAVVLVLIYHKKKNK